MKLAIKPHTTLLHILSTLPSMHRQQSDVTKGLLLHGINQTSRLQLQDLQEARGSRSLVHSTSDVLKGHTHLPLELSLQNGQHSFGTFVQL